MKPGRQRLDQLLVDRGLAESRARAQRLVLAGQVRVDGVPAGKPGGQVKAGVSLEVVGGEKYVSRGGLKLEHGLEEFGLAVSGMTVLDVGASTGGFTDCVLQRGAARVAAIDVGQGQLAWKLRCDSRVLVLERCNARRLTAASLPSGWVPADLVVVDCSFISLRMILPSLEPLVRAGGHLVVLVKPQFEAGRAEADRGAGVIRDALVHDRVLAELEAFVGRDLPSLVWRRQVASPLLGPAGNREFLVHLERKQT